MSHVTDKQLMNRLRRAHGHLATIIGMIEANRDGLEVAQQGQQLHAIGGLAEAATQHHLGQRSGGLGRALIGGLVGGTLRPLRQLADQVGQFHRHVQGFHLTGHCLGGRRQALRALRIGAVTVPPRSRPQGMAPAARASSAFMIQAR